MILNLSLKMISCQNVILLILKTIEPCGCEFDISATFSEIEEISYIIDECE